LFGGCSRYLIGGGLTLKRGKCRYAKGVEGPKDSEDFDRLQAQGEEVSSGDYGKKAPKTFFKISVGIIETESSAEKPG